MHREAEKNEPLFFYNQFYSSKNFDSSINKEKYKKERDTQSTYRNTHTNNTSYSMVNVKE